MLEAAKLYEDQLNICMAKTVLDQSYKWYHLSYPESIITVADNFWDKIQLVSTNNGVVQGYFEAHWQRPENYLDYIACINFDSKNKNLFAADIRRFLKYLVYDLNASKIMWSVVIGNSIEKHYDRFIKRFSGRVIGIEKHAHFINGEYYDKKLYEWINDYYKCNSCGNKEKHGGNGFCQKCRLGEMDYYNPFKRSL